jgi:hypothetical protein
MGTQDYNPEQAIGQLVPVDYPGERANPVGFGRQSGFLSILDKTDPKGGIVFETIAHHVQISWLEYPKGQRATGKQDCVEWEQGDGQGRHGIT